MQKKHRDTEMEIGREILRSKTTEKLLGVHISSSLTWDTHVEKLCQTLKQSSVYCHNFHTNLLNNQTNPTMALLFFMFFEVCLYCQISLIKLKLGFLVG